MSTKRVVLLAAISSLLASYGCSCGGGEGNPDGGPDAGGTALKLLRATSGDGSKIVAEFDKPVSAASAQPSDFTLTSDAGAVAETISSVAVDGATVTLTLSAPLPKGPAYDVGVAGLEGDDGSVVTEEKVALEGTLYLAMVWHQHQPVYLDPSGGWEWSRGPWVRKHATKDYYDMVAMIGDYPDIHVQVNLTPVLLMQLEDFYVARLKDHVNVAANTLNTTTYFAQRPSTETEPVTDPWIDLLLSPTPEPSALTPEQVGWFYKDAWSAFSISGVMLGRFPAYKALDAKKNITPGQLTKADLLDAKVWFQLAWFDPRFLRGPVTLPDGSVVNLSDLVTEQADGTFTADAPFTEEIAQRLVVEEFKVLKNVVEAHRRLSYDATAKTGQVEVMTTPFYHPILPLLADTDLAKEAMPQAALPQTRFQYPLDADVHVAKAVKRYTDVFGHGPTGMWPAEGSVAEAVVPIFEKYGVRWIATDKQVLEKSTSTAATRPLYSPYRIDADTEVGDGATTDDELAIVFRDTEISDKIGFAYQGSTAGDNVVDFMASLRKHKPRYGEDRLLTIILDGENAWEWYAKDNDAIGFLEGMYEALETAQTRDEIRTVTVSEYLDGNAARKVPAHPVHDLPELEPLFAASWISGSFSTWIGEDEENLAWDYLAEVRADMATFEGQGLTRPDPMAAAPAPDTAAWYRYRAWETLYAAEGSDWFWWYGTDQTAAGGDDRPFDRIFTGLLNEVYRYATLAGISGATSPGFPPILRVCEAPSKTPLAPVPTIDGVFTPDDGSDIDKANEWTQAGAGLCQDVDRSSANDVIKHRYHGLTGTTSGTTFTADTLWMALRLNQPLSAYTNKFQLRLYFSQKHIVALPDTIEQDPKLATTVAGTPLQFTAGGAAFELRIDGLEAVGAPTVGLYANDGTSWSTTASAATGVEVARAGDVVELKIPLALLKWQAGDPLELLVTAVNDNPGGTPDDELDRSPDLRSLIVFADRSQLVEVKFVLDATGTQLPLNSVSPINNPPPPGGTGKAFIVGKVDGIAPADDPLGNWTPNTKQMFDDGTNGDATAGDNLWTYRILVSPETKINYKYTIGSAGQSWSGTEEFPITNRGFNANDTNANTKMELKDVFADRPNPDGSLGAKTQVIDP